MAQRLWQGGAGVLTILIITHAMSAEAQGWYYSFLSFAALYTLFDLGLSLVLVQTAAHYSVETRWQAGGNLTGNGAERLRALFAFAGRLYIGLAVGYIIIVGPAGWLFFDTARAHPVAWQGSWIGLTLVTSLSLLPLPLLAIVEGSGEVSEVAAVRLVQAILGSIATWLVLVGGGGLWAPVMAPLAAFLTTTGWLFLLRPGIIGALTANYRLIAWRTEIWPLQWRLGISWLSGYLLTQIQILVLFASSDAVAAGQMGLSLTIGNMIGLLSQAFIIRHVPTMAKAAARRDWDFMDRIFRRDLILSCLLFGAGAAVVLLATTMIAGSRYADRILPLPALAGLLAALFLGNIQSMLAMQLRSYRREPLVWIAVAGAIATLALALVAARSSSVTGVVLIMAAVQLLFVLPCSLWVFRDRNRLWRKD